MFGLYKREFDAAGNVRLVCWDDELKIAGCNSGIICKELRKILKPNDNADVGWKIPVSKLSDKDGYSIIIELKPQNENEVVLFELDTVFGYSYPEWSPIMFRLKQLYNEERTTDWDIYNFIYPPKAEIVYTMNYLSGGIENGTLIGKWTFPVKSSTNSVLFWPDAMSFFYKQIKETDPQFLNEQVRIIQ